MRRRDAHDPHVGHHTENGYGVEHGVPRANVLGARKGFAAEPDQVKDVSHSRSNRESGREENNVAELDDEHAVARIDASELLALGLVFCEAEGRRRWEPYCMEAWDAPSGATPLAGLLTHLIFLILGSSPRANEWQQEVRENAGDLRGDHQRVLAHAYVVTSGRSERIVVGAGWAAWAHEVVPGMREIDWALIKAVYMSAA
eukprot:scaffold4410_cov32-Tisochrysis_lutea.AAC.2